MKINFTFKIINISENIFIIIKEDEEGFSNIGCFTKVSIRNSRALSFKEWFYNNSSNFFISLVNFENIELVNKLLENNLYYEY